jgi:hypothetical protein
LRRDFVDTNARQKRADCEQHKGGLFVQFLALIKAAAQCTVAKRVGFASTKPEGRPASSAKKTPKTILFDQESARNCEDFC